MTPYIGFMKQILKTAHLFNQKKPFTTCYAAGIVDGEGAISIARTGGRGFGVRVAVKQALKGWEMLEFLRTNFGARISTVRCESDNHLPVKEARWSGANADQFLFQIGHHLIVKKRIYCLAADFSWWLDRQRLANGAMKWHDANQKIGEAFYQEMRQLNLRGGLAFSPAQRIHPCLRNLTANYREQRERSALPVPAKADMPAPRS